MYELSKKRRNKVPELVDLETFLRTHLPEIESTTYILIDAVNESERKIEITGLPVDTSETFLECSIAINNQPRAKPSWLQNGRDETAT